MNLISCIFLSRPFLVAQLALWDQHPEPKTVVDTRHRATCEEFLMCGHYCARVTIFAHFGRPYGRPLNPSMTGLDSYPFLGRGSGGNRRRRSPVEYRGNLCVRTYVWPSVPPPEAHQRLAQASQSHSSQLRASLQEAWTSL